jgi:hypothetical protein
MAMESIGFVRGGRVEATKDGWGSNLGADEPTGMAHGDPAAGRIGPQLESLLSMAGCGRTASAFRSAGCCLSWA